MDGEAGAGGRDGAGDAKAGRRRTASRIIAPNPLCGRAPSPTEQGVATTSTPATGNAADLDRFYGHPAELT
jgi:hypothetical protein